MNADIKQLAAKIESKWKSPRWQGVRRDYSALDVARLMPSIPIKYSIAERGAEIFYERLRSESLTNALGTLTGAQAVQMARAGLKAIYLSGWQVAADNNLAAQTYPDQSLYPSNSVPAVIKRINNAFMRADQIDRVEGIQEIDYYLPILADAEAGFGGPLHAFELMKSMIEAGASGVHFEDQLAAEKKCGHLGGKVLVPTSQFIRTLTAARLAADVMGTDTLIVARTDALNANLLTNDVDPLDAPFLTGQRTSEGYYHIKDGMPAAVARGLAYAPYADLVWFETAKPDIGEAKEFAREIHAKNPGKMLAYNCSPSFNWKKSLSDKAIASFQRDLAELGYCFQFITLAGWHLINYHTFDIAYGYREGGMSQYVELQEAEFRRAKDGYTAVKHQREAGTGYYDQVLMTVSGGEASTTAYAGSTEADQFEK